MGNIGIPLETAESISLRSGVIPPILLFSQNSILAGFTDETLIRSLILKAHTSRFRDNLLLIEFCIKNF